MQRLKRTEPRDAEEIITHIQTWRREPSAVATIGLCEALRPLAAALRTHQLDQLATFVAERYGADARVLLALGRVQLAADALLEAQGSFAQAARLAPECAAGLRLLGEVLLRRGHAERATRFFERAREVSIAATSALPEIDDDAELLDDWLELARRLTLTEATHGLASVAEAVARSYPAVPTSQTRRRAMHPPSPSDPHGVDTSVEDPPAALLDALRTPEVPSAGSTMLPASLSPTVRRVALPALDSLRRTVPGGLVAVPRPTAACPIDTDVEVPIELDFSETPGSDRR